MEARGAGWGIAQLAVQDDLEDLAKGFQIDSHLLLTIVITVGSPGGLEDTKVGAEGQLGTWIMTWECHEYDQEEQLF